MLRCVKCSSGGEVRVNDSESLFSKGKFNHMFDQAMVRALKDTYEAPLFTDEQIIISWELVRQRLNGETSKINSED
jgi:hypothetical protein